MYTVLKKLCLVLVIAFTQLSAFGQIEGVADLGEFSGRLLFTQKFDNHLIVLAEKAYNNHEVWSVDLITSTSEKIFESEYALSPIANSTGIFFISYQWQSNGNDRDYFINYIDKDGNAFTSSKFHGPYDGAQGSISNLWKNYNTICDNRFYTYGFYANKHCVWESDPSNSQTTRIFQSDELITGIAALGDSLLITTKTENNNNKFYHYTHGQTATYFANVDLMNYDGRLSVAGKDANYIYYNTKGPVPDYQKAIYRTDLTEMGTTLFLDNYKALHMIFNSDDLYFSSYTSSWDNVTGFFKLNVNDLTSIDTLKFSKKHTTESTKIFNYFGDNYLLISSTEYGIEIGRLNEKDSVELIADHSEGPTSSIPFPYARWNWHPNYYQSKKMYAVGLDSTVYTVLSNGNDQDYYMYSFKKGEILNSFFKIPNPTHISDLYIFNDQIFWCRLENNNLKIEKGQLNSIQQQSKQIEKLETWHKKVTISSKSYFNSSYEIFPNYIQMDSAENAYIQFSIPGNIKYNTDIAAISSDTIIFQKFKSNNYVAKLDKYGQMLWVNSLGGSGLYFKNYIKHKVQLNNDNDLIVIGEFYDKGYFDSDSISPIRTGVFAAKINGKTGEVIWKKQIMDDMLHYKLYLPNIAIDKTDNIYLQINYEADEITVDGMQINSDAEYGIALAKFSTSGSPLWLKELPSVDSSIPSGHTLLRYNEKQNTLTFMQSQNYYNMGYVNANNSLVANVVNVINVDGEQIHTFNFSGNNNTSLTTGIINQNNQFFGAGYYKDDIKIGYFKSNSTTVSEDIEHDYFDFRYDYKLNQVVSAEATENSGFYPYEIDMHNDYIYVYGANANKSLQILKYEDNGKYIGYKNINQLSDVFYKYAPIPGYQNYFDVNSDHIVILGSNFDKDTTYGVSSLFLSDKYVSIQKIENSEWNEDPFWLSDFTANLPFDKDDIFIYPNPSDNVINIIFKNLDSNFHNYSISDLTGRVVLTGQLNSSKIHQLSILPLAQGTYVLNLFGADKTASQKIIKY